MHLPGRYAYQEFDSYALAGEELQLFGAGGRAPHGGATGALVVPAKAWQISVGLGTTINLGSRQAELAQEGKAIIAGHSYLSNYRLLFVPMVGEPFDGTISFFLPTIQEARNTTSRPLLVLLLGLIPGVRGVARAVSAKLGFGTPTLTMVTPSQEGGLLRSSESEVTEWLQEIKRNQAKLTPQQTGDLQRAIMEQPTRVSTVLGSQLALSVFRPGASLTDVRDGIAALLQNPPPSLTPPKRYALLNLRDLFAIEVPPEDAGARSADGSSRPQPQMQTTADDENSRP